MRYTFPKEQPPEFEMTETEGEEERGSAHCSARAANRVGTAHETGARDRERVRVPVPASLLHICVYIYIFFFSFCVGVCVCVCVRACARDDQQFDNTAQFDLMHR